MMLAMLGRHSAPRHPSCILRVKHASEIVKTWDDNHHPETYMGKSQCRVCYTKSVRVRSMAAGGRAGRRMPDGSPIPQVRTACAGCKVNMCEGWFDAWDHHACQPKRHGVVTLCGIMMSDA